MKMRWWIVLAIALVVVASGAAGAYFIFKAGETKGETEGEEEGETTQKTKCSAVFCPRAQECIEGLCVDRSLDKNTVCGDKVCFGNSHKQCLGGECTFVPGWGDCNGVLYGPGYHCKDGKKVKNACDESRCKGIVCGTGQSCNPVTGLCDARGYGGKCSGASSGELYAASDDPAGCTAGHCPPDYRCLDGECVRDGVNPCDKCPPPDLPDFSDCIDGECYKKGASGGCVTLPAWEKAPGNNYQCRRSDTNDCERICCAS